MKLIKCLSAVVASVVLVSGPSWAVPATNADGDYLFPGRRGNRQSNWQVSDPDPNGLNCRIARQFQDMTMNGRILEQLLYTNNIHEISEWPVVSVFERGERLRAVIGNLNNQMVLLDKRGKPWIAVFIEKGNIEEGNCFVRANSRWIVPIPEDPVTAEPLE